MGPFVDGRFEKKMGKKFKVKKITSLSELRRLAAESDDYAQLAKIAASNLGQPCETLALAMQSLCDAASETDERGVVGEINFVRDLVK